MRLSRSFALALLSGAGLMVADNLPAQGLRTVSQSRHRTSESRLSVDLGFAVGTLRVYPDATGALYRSVLTYDDASFEPEQDYSAESGQLKIDLSSIKGRRSRNHREIKQRLELALSPEIPAYLELSFGAGDADLDLGGLSLAEAEINTGASESRIRFSQPNRMACRTITFHVGAVDFQANGLGNARCRHVSMTGGAGDLTLDFGGDWGDLQKMTGEMFIGVGSLTLRIPEGVGVRIQIDKFLASFDPAGFTKRGRSYYSSSYDQAKNKLDLQLKATLGNIDVVWVRAPAGTGK